MKGGEFVSFLVQGSEKGSIMWQVTEHAGSNRMW